VCLNNQLINTSSQWDLSLSKIGKQRNSMSYPFCWKGQIFIFDQNIFLEKDIHFLCASQTYMILKCLKRYVLPQIQSKSSTLFVIVKEKNNINGSIALPRSEFNSLLIYPNKHNSAFLKSYKIISSYQKETTRDGHLIRWMTNNQNNKTWTDYFIASHLLNQ